MPDVWFRIAILSPHNDSVLSKELFYRWQLT